MNVQRDMMKAGTFVITVWPPFDFTKSYNLLAEAFANELPPRNNDERYVRGATPDYSCPYL
jgi:hypothetical protein